AASCRKSRTAWPWSTFCLEMNERAAANKRLRADSNCTMRPQMTSKTTTALTQSRQWGRIEVFPSAVAAIAGHAAMRCYGISGMAGRGLRDGFAELPRREHVAKGVDVVQDRKSTRLNSSHEWISYAVF